MENMDSVVVALVVILGVITLILWIFLPFSVMRIEGNVKAAKKTLEEIKRLLSDWRYESEKRAAAAIELRQDDVDIELGRDDMVNANWK